MLIPLGQHERRPAVVHRLDDVVADTTVAQVVNNQLLIQRLELHAPIGIGTPARLEGRRLHEDEVFEGAQCRLCPRVHAVAKDPSYASRMSFGVGNSTS